MPLPLLTLVFFSLRKHLPILKVTTPLHLHALVTQVLGLQGINQYTQISYNFKFQIQQTKKIKLPPPPQTHTHRFRKKGNHQMTLLGPNGEL